MIKLKIQHLALLQFFNRYIHWQQQYKVSDLLHKNLDEYDLFLLWIYIVAAFYKF